MIFGDLDRFGHVVYYGMQIKYEPSISQSASQGLIEDAELATHNPFRHPQTGREEYISSFYVANAGTISDDARDNFFNTVSRKGIRDARLLDGNALLLLDKAAALNRTAQIRERLTGLLQEVRRNRRVLAYLAAQLPACANEFPNKAFPLDRCRNVAAAAYLTAPLAISDLPVEVVDHYWNGMRMLNEIAATVGATGVDRDIRKRRAEAFVQHYHEYDNTGLHIENTVVKLLTPMGGQVK